MIDIDYFKALLASKHKEIKASVASGKDATKPVELDQTSVGRLSRMDAMQVQAMALASEQRRQEMLTAIESAFIRIDNGDFGYCVRCEEEIAFKRLELNPTAFTCIRCANASGKLD